MPLLFKSQGLYHCIMHNCIEIELKSIHILKMGFDFLENHKTCVFYWYFAYRVSVPCSPTFCEACACHLEPPLLLSLTHGIFYPKSCHSSSRLTADIIKAAGPPDTLLAQSRNANRHRATWALAQIMPSMDNRVDGMICFFLFS